MKIKYIADDGKEFDFKSECEAYENDIKNFNVNCSRHLYCENFEHEPIDLVNNPFDINQAHFVYIFDEIGVKLADRLYQEYGVYLPKESGVWVYFEELDNPFHPRPPYKNLIKAINTLNVIKIEYESFINRAYNYEAKFKGESQ